MQITFDIETNAITDWLELSDLKEVLCMVVSIDGAEPKEVSVKAGVELLSDADCIVGQNILSFDLPALKILHGLEVSEHQVFDTMIASRLMYASQRDIDFQTPGFPKELVGSHSLKAWGYRLTNRKYESPAFTKRTDELVEYCIQDVKITMQLFDRILAHPAYNHAVRALDIEMRFAHIIKQQERHGFAFDVKAAQKLHANLRKRILEIEAGMGKVFPPKVIPRVSEKTGKTLKPKVEEFNPASRVQVADRLIEKYNWQPTEFTPDGRPRVDEAVLDTLDYPEAQILKEYFLLNKRLGQLADGDEAWLKLVTASGRIHGKVNTNGAITGRCTHRGPNMAQVPAEPEYRRLFTADKGGVLVGVDASGLELRCLAHFLGLYDKGAYAKAILDGDIHWTNAVAFGLIKDQPQDKSNPEHKAARNQAKGAIYALIYGAGDDKLGLVLGRDRKGGRKARANFESQVPAYLKLKEDVLSNLANRGYIKGIDGRPLYPRSQHAALNTLLQSAGAVVMKKACILAWEDFRSRGLAVHQVASIHDEYQFTCSKDISDDVGNLAVCAIRLAGQVFNFRCRLDGEYRVGANWAETH